MEPGLFKDGIFIAITGYLIVFAALTLFVGALYFLQKIIKLRVKKKMIIKSKECAEKADEQVSGLTIAAISTAIHLFLNEQHDDESYELTIKKISKRYSPWSSKIYSMNNINRR